MDAFEVLKVCDGLKNEFCGEFPDILIFGDGSGTTIGNPFAWACFVVDVESLSVRRLTGGGNCGTSNYAELSPYVNAIWWIASNSTSPKKIGIVSDSELTVKCGKREYERRANGHLWASIEYFERSGFVICWHHVRRNINVLNATCDEVAGELRKMFKCHEDKGNINAEPENRSKAAPR